MIISENGRDGRDFLRKFRSPEAAGPAKLDAYVSFVDIEKKKEKIGKLILIFLIHFVVAKQESPFVNFAVRAE